MTKTSKPPSGRAAIRKARIARRVAKADRRRVLLDLIISGYAYSHIAETFKISVATVRREVDRALAQQTPHSTEHYVALQMARVQKALLYVDLRLEKGDLRAVPALATLLGEFDRYQGVAAALRQNAAPPALLLKKAPKALESPDRTMKLPAVETAADRLEPALSPVVPE